MEASKILEAASEQDLSNYIFMNVIYKIILNNYSNIYICFYIYL